VQAAIASACAFTAGGLIPFAGAFAPTPGAAATSIVAFTILGLVATGMISAKTAGSKLLTPTLRVIAGGILGMAITAGIGRALHLSGI
jgi:VIT1/CCC1 family predicted Fe2+/Mn2+ transporter